jgi:uncharacterized protein YecT (DUF1311 family)
METEKAMMPIKRKENTMKKKNIAAIAGGTALMITTLVSGCATHDKNLGIQGELRDARLKLGANYTGTQTEMTMVSEFQLNLAEMELAHLHYLIANQNNYGKIEADFQKDEQAWEQRFKDEQEKTSEFEGGSMAPMDLNMRMTAFIEKRISELKAKWLKK